MISLKSLLRYNKQDQFKIISKTSDHCIISGDGDFVENTLSRIEANLAGTMLLYECDSHVMRFVHWALWYGLSCNKVNGAYIGYDELDPVTGETVFWFYGLNKKIKIRQSVLERTWSGRLYIQDYRESRWMFLSYLRRDIDSRLKMVKLRFYRVN